MPNKVNNREIVVKSIVTPSKLPGMEYVINPYRGCYHGCKYCYAQFMQRFTKHGEKWGDFVDIKANAVELLSSQGKKKYINRSITFGSVTDPYQPLEEKYCLTRKLLEQLLAVQPRLLIITKSSLVMRDIEILKKFKFCTVAISLALTNEENRKILEPRATAIQERILALQQLHFHGIATVLFLSPILPHITDWKNLVLKTQQCISEYWFENINLYPAIIKDLSLALDQIQSGLGKIYRSGIYSPGSNYWQSMKMAIESFCHEHGFNHRIYFH